MTRTLSVRLDDSTLEKLDVMAQATDRSRAWLMAHTVRQYVEHEAWRIEAIRKAVARLDDGTARFTSQAAVSAWVESWDTADERSPPECE